MSVLSLCSFLVFSCYPNSMCSWVQAGAFSEGLAGFGGGFGLCPMGSARTLKDLR